VVGFCLGAEAVSGTAAGIWSAFDVVGGMGAVEGPGITTPGEVVGIVTTVLNVCGTGAAVGADANNVVVRITATD
jgi:hypothetical protein